jgi:hypothetical protein
LSQVEESATKSTYKLGVGFERYEDKGEKSAPKFVPTSNYHKEEETTKSTKTHCPSNPKPSFNPRREVRKETPRLRKEAFICMFCGCAGHLDEFCFCRKRIEKRHFDYARNSYRNEFIDFPPHYYSRAPSRLLHVPNHRSYGYGSRENSFVPGRFGYDPHSHSGDRFLHRHGFPAGESYTHFEPRHFDGPCISRLEKIFQADFSFAKSSVKCLISQSSSKLWKWHRRLGHLSFNLLCRLKWLSRTPRIALAQV